MEIKGTVLQLINAGFEDVAWMCGNHGFLKTEAQLELPMLSATDSTELPHAPHMEVPCKMYG